MPGRSIKNRPCEHVTCSQILRKRQFYSIEPAASPKHVGESNSLSCTSVAGTAINAARASSAPWGNALVANMVIV